MKRHLYNCEAGCPVESTLQIISGKWKSIILYHIIQENVCRFSQFQRWMPECSHRMLALPLAELEQDGVLQKHVYPVIPPKTEYRLTDFGETLKPVIDVLENWGNFYNQVHEKDYSVPLDQTIKN